MKKVLLITRGGLNVIPIEGGFWESTPWPFSELYIYKNKITVCRLFGKIEFYKDEILNIEKEMGYLRRGVRINTKINVKKPFVTFWSFHYNKILSKLKDVGYPVNR